MSEVVPETSPPRITSHLHFGGLEGVPVDRHDQGVLLGTLHG